MQKIGKEVKIGLAVIGVLLTTFGVVLYKRLTKPSDLDVAAAASDADAQKTNAADRPTVVAASDTEKPGDPAANGSEPRRSAWGHTSSGLQDQMFAASNRRADPGAADSSNPRDATFLPANRDATAPSPDDKSAGGFFAGHNPNHDAAGHDDEHRPRDLPGGGASADPFQHGSASAAAGGDPFQKSNRLAADTGAQPAGNSSALTPVETPPLRATGAGDPAADFNPLRRSADATAAAPSAGADQGARLTSGSSPADAGPAAAGGNPPGGVAPAADGLAPPGGFSAGSAFGPAPNGLTTNVAAPGGNSTGTSGGAAPGAFAPVSGGGPVSVSPPASGTNNPPNRFTGSGDASTGGSAPSNSFGGASGGFSAPAGNFNNVPAGNTASQPITSNPPSAFGSGSTSPPGAFRSSSDGLRSTDISASAAIAGDPSAATAGKYVVQPNDNYWIISKKVYGNGGYFKAIYEHNRRQHPKADRLQVGETLETPDVAYLQKNYPDLCPTQGHASAPQRTMPASARVRPGTRVYIVEEGDTLFEIARRELGKPSRWGEIYSLNREVLGSDFDYLKPGTELLLPGDTRPDTLTRQPGETSSR